MPADKDGKVEEGVAEELVRAVEEEAVAVPSPEKKGATEVVDEAAATAPSEAEPMKVLQSIAQARSQRRRAATSGSCHFSPELRTLEGHSETRALRRPLYFCDDLASS